MNLHTAAHGLQMRFAQQTCISALHSPAAAGEMEPGFANDGIGVGGPGFLQSVPDPEVIQVRVAPRLFLAIPTPCLRSPTRTNFEGRRKKTPPKRV